jgi:hypothetical protein
LCNAEKQKQNKTKLTKNLKYDLKKWKVGQVAWCFTGAC